MPARSHPMACSHRADAGPMPCCQPLADLGRRGVGPTSWCRSSTVPTNRRCMPTSSRRTIVKWGALLFLRKISKTSKFWFLQNDVRSVVTRSPVVDSSTSVMTALCMRLCKYVMNKVKPSVVSSVILLLLVMLWSQFWQNSLLMFVTVRHYSELFFFLNFDTSIDLFLLKKW